MRIAALVKQIPAFEAMQLGPDGRLVRAGLALEMNAYCRRAVAQAVAFAAHDGGDRGTDGRNDHDVTFFTMGPDTAEDCLREAISWADAHGVPGATGVHVCDAAFAGSDTLATARTLAAALQHCGGFDIVLCGRNAVDSDTGQVGPQLAELLETEFVGAAKSLTLIDRELSARCEDDDGYHDIRVALPAVVACAERLIDPCKVDPVDRALVDGARIRTLRASELGAGPWGTAASPTRVGATRTIASTRAALRWPQLSVDAQVERAVDALVDRFAFTTASDHEPHPLRDPVRAVASTPSIVVVAEPDRNRSTRELLAAAARLAAGHEVVVAFDPASRASAWGVHGADVVVNSPGAVESDTAAALTAWCRAHDPQIVVAPSTTWGREVAARAAAALGCGLTGDAVDLERADDGQLIAWKPAFGGAIVAAIHCSSTPQFATVRPGVMEPGRARDFAAPVEDHQTPTRSHLRLIERRRDDDIDTLAEAARVIAIGRGVEPEDVHQLAELQALLDAELAATRKITDKGWMPRATQLGITGRSIAPQLLVSIGAHGKFNHSVGFRNAGTVLAINSDPDAPIFDVADAGIVADWHDAVPCLVARLAVVVPSLAQSASGR